MYLKRCDYVALFKSSLIDTLPSPVWSYFWVLLSLTYSDCLSPWDDDILIGFLFMMPGHCHLPQGHWLRLLVFIYVAPVSFTFK